MGELLVQDGPIHLYNLNKYLATDSLSKTCMPKEMAEQIRASLVQHPEYLQLIFSAEHLKQVLSWNKRGRIDNVPEPELFMGLQMWGLAETKIVNRPKEAGFLRIEILPEAKVLLEWLERQDLEADEGKIDRIWDRMLMMLGYYGFMEIRPMYEQYQKLFGSVSWEDFQRYLYLRGRYRGEIVSGGSYENQEKNMEQDSWVSLTREIAANVINWWHKYPELRKLEYAAVTKKQILNMKKNGFGAVYPQWDMVTDMLCAMGLKDWDAEHMVEIFYEKVMEGAGMAELMNEENQECKAAKTDEQVILEHALVSCWSGMGIPVLKGHSRVEIAEKSGKSIFEIVSEDEYRLEGYQSLEKQEDSGKKIDMEAPCPCGSGKRYRQCCGRKL